MSRISKMVFKNMEDPQIIRDNWVINQLESIPENDSILDCGAGEQKYKSYCKHLKYLSQDFCEFDGKAEVGLDKTVKWDTSNIDIISDIINIPVENESFDHILCTEVLEHINHPELAIKEFARILRKNGTMILTAPFHGFTHMAPYHFCTGFNRYWYKSILEENGLKIEKLENIGNYFDCIALDLRRMNLMSKTYAKPLTLFQKILFVLCIKNLKKISKISTNSEEFVTFQYMVVARKNAKKI